MVEGGMRCVKYLLFLFNLIFVIAGIALIAAGAYVKIKLNEYEDIFGTKYVGPDILLIIVGVIIFLLAFFGCCGAIRENYCLTMTYSICLGIIFILEIAGGIAAFVYRDKIENEIFHLLDDSIDRYNSSDTGVTQIWDDMQQEFKCCGANNSDDWLRHNKKIPDTCCKDKKSPCTTGYFKDGCEHALEDFIKGKIVIVGGVGIGLAFVQVVGVVFACCLARAIKKEYEVV